MFERVQNLINQLHLAMINMVNLKFSWILVDLIHKISIKKKRTLIKMLRGRRLEQLN